MSTHPLPEAVLVDMDGTLVNTEHLWHVAERATMRFLGSEWTAEDQKFSLGGPLENVTARMQAKSGTSLSQAEISSILLDKVEDTFRSSDVSFTAGSEQLLDDLVAAGIPLALVSASPRRVMDCVLDIMGAEHFTTTIAGDEVERSKPDPLPYLLAAERLEVDITRCVILEDSPNGVAAGHSSGGVVVAIPDLVPIEPGDRLVVIHTLDEVTPAHLAEWLAEHTA